MAVDPSSVFYVKGELKVINSATVICVRQRKHTDIEVSKEDFKATKRGEFGNFLPQKPYKFVNQWEVLFGQSEVINYLRSTPKKLVTMRYGGEFKLAGGNVDPGETLIDCAKRELQEEFLRPLKKNVPTEKIKLRAFNVKQTRPVRSKSNVMHNFVALEHENQWLATLDVNKINEGLASRREKFAELIRSGEYWKLSQKAKEEVSPEVYKLEWMPLAKAVRLMLSSMIPGVYTNDYQKEQFKLIGRKRRDPMYMTAAALVELDAFPNENSLIKWSNTVHTTELVRQEQWLFEGMTNEEVESAFATRTKQNKGANPSFKQADALEKMRETVTTTISKL